MAGSGVRLSLRQLLAIVAAVAVVLAVVLPLYRAMHWTIYAPGFDEGRFSTVRVGMAVDEVEALMGPPLRRWPFDSTTEIWAYTDQGTYTSGYHRRWIFVEDDSIRRVDSYYFND